MEIISEIVSVMDLSASSHSWKIEIILDRMFFPGTLVMYSKGSIMH